MEQIITPKQQKYCVKTTIKGNKKVSIKKHYTNYSLYIYKILKLAQRNVGVTKTAMSMLNSFIYDIMQRLTEETKTLARKNKKVNITLHDVVIATRIILPGELSIHAASKASQAVYTYSKTNKINN